MLKEYEITIEKSLYCLDVRLGLISIANIWPPQKKKRDYWQVRLLFNQEPGKVDYSKDLHCATKEECLQHIHKELKKLIKKLHRYFILNKF